MPAGSAILYTPERWYTSRKLSPQALWRTRASPGPGSPAWTSSHFKTSGPPCWWMRIALGIASPFAGRYLFLRRNVAGRLLRRALHRRESRFLHFKPLYGHGQDVQIRVEPGLDRPELGDALVDLGHRGRGSAQSGHRQPHGPPQILQEIERIGRSAHGAGLEGRRSSLLSRSQEFQQLGT